MRADEARCARCGAYLSMYGQGRDRFCWACHPTRESRPRVCASGHDLAIYGVRNGHGVTCGRCKQARRAA